VELIVRSVDEPVLHGILPIDPALFDVHFPGNPVYPLSVIVVETHSMIARHIGVPSSSLRIKSFSLLTALRPHEAVAVKIKTAVNKVSFKATCGADDRPAFRGLMAFNPIEQEG